jgi:predicted N-acyltransferase
MARLARGGRLRRRAHGLAAASARRARERRIVAACPLYEKHHSEGEFVFDWGWADAAQRAGIDYYPKLLVGVPFTPVTGARFLTAPGTDRTRAIARLGAGLRELCDRHRSRART